MLAEILNMKVNAIPLASGVYLRGNLCKGMMSFAIRITRWLQFMPIYYDVPCAMYSLSSQWHWHTE